MRYTTILILLLTPSVASADPLQHPRLDREAISDRDKDCYEWVDSRAYTRARDDFSDRCWTRCPRGTDVAPTAPIYRTTLGRKAPHRGRLFRCVATRRTPPVRCAPGEDMVWWPVSRGRWDTYRVLRERAVCLPRIDIRVPDKGHGQPYCPPHCGRK